MGVNDSWMTDSGRALYKQVRSDDRLLTPRVNDTDKILDHAITTATNILKDKKIAVVGSCHGTLEELYLLNRLSKITNSKKYLRGYFGEDDGILLSADRTPNLRGALLSGFTNSYPKDNLKSLNNDLKRGGLDAVFVYRDDILNSEVDEELLKGIPLVFMGTQKNSTSDLAEVLIPSLTSFEKKGTFINRSFFAQGFEQAVPGPAGLLPDLLILSQIIEGLEVESKIDPDLSLIWKKLGSPPKSPLKGITFNDVLESPVKVDGSKWESLPFVEKKAMHYLPV